MKIDYSKVRHVGLTNHEDLMDMLRSGEVVAIDKKTGRYLTELKGIKLPSPEQAMEKAVAKAAAAST